MKPILLLLTTCLVLTSGCTKTRWLSRRDYSEMQDPFATEDSSVAASAADGTDRSQRGTDSRTGRARVTIPDTDSATAQDDSLSGPKPIQRASAGRDTIGRSGVSTADYPRQTATDPDPATSSGQTARSYSGPQLSDFMNGRTGAATSDRSAASPADALLNQSAIRGVEPRINRTSTPPRLPALSSEAEGFYNSLGAEAQATTDAAVSRGRSAVQQAQTEADNIDDWMKAQQAEWATSTGQARDVTRTASEEFTGTAQESASALSRSARAAMPTFDDFDAANDEPARPLMKSYDTAERKSPLPSKQTTTRAAAPQNTSRTENPFDDPFATEAETPPRTTSTPASGQRSASAAGTADPSGSELFGSDSGWRPVDLQRP